jgi:GT2 family glycosyltransferase
VVLLLNSDAIIDSAAVAALLRAFEDDPRLGIAGARLVHPGGTPQWSGGPLPTLLWLVVMVSGCARFFPRRESTRGASSVAWVSGAAMAFRRETWEAAGPFRESYRFYAQDLELCARAGHAGWGVRIVEEARVVHGGGATMRRWRGITDLPHDPSLLWLDLLTWGRRHYGRAWAMLALPAICVAALVRIVMRRILRSPRSETAAYAAALRQLLIERQQIAGKSIARVARLDETAPGLADRPRP